jgi:hypothetical protein
MPKRIKGDRGKDACEPTGIVELATRGEELVAALGEHYLREHFVINCPVDDALFTAARLETHSRGCFPRILVDPWQLLGQAPDQASLEADVALIQRAVRERPQAFARLFDCLDNPAEFSALAEELGLTEAASRRAGGGLLALVVVLVACVVVAGCSPTKCTSVDPVSGLRCTKPNGHVPGGAGTHVNNGLGKARSW